jgi:hypothetical protein
MSVNLSPLGGAGAQFFSNNGVPLAGGLLYTYLAGTSTPAATYTSSSGLTALANPIVLDSAGRVPTGEIWLTDGISYKFVLKDATDVLIATWDNLSGINSNFIAYTSQQQTITATAGQTVFDLTLDYVAGANNLAVYVNGSKQIVTTNYTETDSNTVTFLTGLNVGDLVQFSTATPVASNVTTADNVSYTPANAGAVTTTVQSKLRETISVKDFGAIGDGVADDTAAVQAAINSSSNAIIFVPKGTYKITSTLTCPKPKKLIIQGDGIFYKDEVGSTFNYTGAGTLFSFGVADGNPDTTGYSGDYKLINLGLKTSTGAIGAEFTNCVYITIEGCDFLGWSNKVISLVGGNIITKITNNEIFGNQGTSILIDMGDYQFGNYDTRITNNHMANCGKLMTLGEGRFLQFSSNTIDGANILGFDCNGTRPTSFICDSNYFENVANSMFSNGASPGNGFLEFTFTNNEVWTNAVVTTFGNLTKVGRLIATNNLVPNAELAANQAWLGLFNVYSNISLLDSYSSIIRAPYLNKEYEDNLAYVMQTSELLGIDGNFQNTVSSAPSGWTNLAVSSTWANDSSNVLGNTYCKMTKVGTEYDVAQKVLSFTPLNIAAPSYFIMANTATGWFAFNVNGTLVYDVGSAITGFDTSFAKFSVPAGITSLTLKIVTNNVTMGVAELRLWQVGVDDYNESGTLGGAIQKAALRNMKRGNY